MKLHVLLALITSSVFIPSSIQAQTSNHFVYMELSEAKPPHELIAKLNGAKIIQSGKAPLGPKYETCWALCLQPSPINGKKIPPVFSVWQPTKGNYLKIGEWSFKAGDFPESVKLDWLNEKTQVGWVINFLDYYASTNTLIAWPQGAKTKQQDLLRQSFKEIIDMDTKTMYEFGNPRDKNGFYTVTKIYTEMEMIQKGGGYYTGVDHVKAKKVYRWNGKGWS